MSDRPVPGSAAQGENSAALGESGVAQSESGVAQSEKPVALCASDVAQGESRVPGDRPLPEQSSAGIKTQLSRGIHLAILAVTVTIQFTLCLSGLIEHSARYQPLWLEITGFLLLAGVAAVTAAYLLTKRYIPPAARWTGIVLVLLAAGAAAVASPAGTHLDPAHWYFGLVGWYGVLLLFDLPLVHLTVFLIANLTLAAVKAAVSHVPDLETWASMAVSALSIYGFQLALGLVVHGVHRVAVRAGEAAAEEEHIRTEEAVAEHLHRDHQRRYVSLLGSTIPMLAGLGYGTLDPADPEVRRRSAHEAARMRRLFAENDNVSDRLVHELRAVIEVAERGGITVDFAARGRPRDLPQEVRRELIDPVSAVLAAAGRTDSTMRVTVVRTPDRVRVSAVGEIPEPPHMEIHIRTGRSERRGGRRPTVGGGGVARQTAVTVTAIDDHPVVLAGMKHWYATADPPITVVAAGPTPKSAWTPPGDAATVVVLDLQLQAGPPAYGELRRLVDAGRQVIVFTMRDDERTALTCLDIGAFTYLTKAEGEEHLVAATHAAADNRPYTPPALAGAFGTNTAADRPRLSLREEEVLIEWFQSESKELVAAKLGITPRTVNSYLDRIRIKYANVGREAKTKANLVARAIQDGLVGVDDL
ncbi:DNA-binding response regulator [Sinosporangium siamense]|uniref:Response regulatory domain-containing protein n=1 Tax=Sinosporangium siamense TaxID=1367973 RepID=A0A919VAC3_9ACTN|nr:response regulator transcription factor [Sinosporangium siamense]GII96288.1 hypothetical protein Ssi02_65190 [Sinosporangium siamense]